MSSCKYFFRLDQISKKERWAKDGTKAVIEPKRSLRYTQREHLLNIWWRSLLSQCHSEAGGGGGSYHWHESVQDCPGQSVSQSQQVGGVAALLYVLLVL